MYLLDTNAVSLLGPARNRTPTENRIADWLKSSSSELYLSVITVSEIETGISRLIRTGASAKAAIFKDWLDLVVELYGARIHSLDLESARLAGRLFDKAVGKGGNPGFSDAAIAAIAQTRALTVMTRNVAHFSLFEAACINPYEVLPGGA